MSDQVLNDKVKQVAEQVSRWSQRDKMRLIQLIAADAEDASKDEQKPLRSLSGILADLGPAPSADEIDEVRREVWQSPPLKSLAGLWEGVDISAEDIDEARREMWGNFPREDI